MAKLPKRLTLAGVQRTGLTDAFVQQDEARDDLGPVSRADFDLLTTLFVKARQSRDRTSHFSSDGNSSGKKTRRDTGQDASN
jgi:hypothetical protein